MVIFMVKLMIPIKVNCTPGKKITAITSTNAQPVNLDL
jgi:hypothetical protein